ncbi:PEPxxWA-CTERM sorting domain-containing protein [Sphingomonas phyllosphaerae]|uniref:PEPxxWA-CTERM sorting domain-containing protein n=1 Tax=Sphingomonas phyllosphaerae TaxID=257003 RepID=UPI0012DD2333
MSTFGRAPRPGRFRAIITAVRQGGVPPEPATRATMIVGFAVIGCALRRKTVLRFVQGRRGPCRPRARPAQKGRSPR